jgi:hypothetical protein
MKFVVFPMCRRRRGFGYSYANFYQDGSGWYHDDERSPPSSAGGARCKQGKGVRMIIIPRRVTPPLRRCFGVTRRFGATRRFGSIRRFGATKEEVHQTGPFAPLPTYNRVYSPASRKPASKRTWSKCGHRAVRCHRDTPGGTLRCIDFKQ